MTFECKMCGMCCRNIKRYRDEAYPLLKNILGEKMPEFNIKDNDGVCVNLMENNKCSIYEQRPTICNTSKMFDILSSVLKIDKKELYEAQALSCIINRKY